ncbi:right-handed parallel beta-helix repeat-containing protein [Paenibacillus provencensis]|uniref:Right-handed parallel beta-helix repeat-containing protein n=1 Tax=Paenibacillus provencensis TaxID=441151 RepID=A0ABW3PY37_9BACL|nr:right-handed parallel beta-helix repeat-containing protein [Paenibacillus sp. MER 78]MCM3127706.1 right-handed parallel beta-helix repeat-containing protein [Paenibacillus sp. MER 78]
MLKLINKFNISFLTILILFNLLIPYSQSSAGSQYYVATNGNDSNLGTVNDPFRTIQKCAQVATSGDTCVIRGGIYRETITPKNSGTLSAPITYKAYANESVRVSATESINSEWTKHTENIYKFNSLNTYLGHGKNQLFLNGTMMTEARWPNISSSPVFIKRNDLAKSSMGYLVTEDPIPGQLVTATLKDEQLSQFSQHFFKDTQINLLTGSLWTPITGKVLQSANDSLQFSYKYNQGGVYYDVSPNTYYYIWGKLELLDSPGEWYIDSSSNVYFWPPNGYNPTNSNIEVKTRNSVFDLRNTKNIILNGIQIFGGTIQTNTVTENLSLLNVNIKYPNHYQYISNWWEIVNGITFNGANTLIQDSIIGYVAGSGVKIVGANSRIINSVIHNTNYTGGNGGLLMASGQGVQILNNTLFNSGSANIIDLRDCSGCIVKRNDIFGAGSQTIDGGAIMITRDSNGGNTEIGYNKIHNNYGVQNPSLRYYGTSGIFLEGNVSNYNIYNNIIWNTSARAITVHPSGRMNISNINIANNTSYMDVTENGVRDSGTFYFPSELIGNGINTNNNIYNGKPYDAPINFEVGSSLIKPYIPGKLADE